MVILYRVGRTYNLLDIIEVVGNLHKVRSDDGGGRLGRRWR